MQLPTRVNVDFFLGKGATEEKQIIDLRLKLECLV